MSVPSKPIGGFRSLWTLSWRASLGAAGRMVRRWPTSATAGGSILAVILVCIVCAPLITAHDPTEISAAVLLPPSVDHVMGTDDLGRDVFARVLYGGRVSLMVGVVSALIAVALGLSIGIIAGFSGGAIDELLMRFTEVFQILPRLLVAIVVVTMIGGSVGNVILVIGVLSWPVTARIIRTQVQVIRQEEFIAAAILSGAGYWRLIVRHVLPNVLPLLVVSASLQVAAAMLAEAALSFLGLGDLMFPTWGQMLQQSQGFLRQAWWMSILPGVTLSLTILSLNLVSDGFGAKLPGTAR